MHNSGPHIHVEHGLSLSCKFHIWLIVHTANLSGILQECWTSFSYLYLYLFTTHYLLALNNAFVFSSITSTFTEIENISSIESSWTGLKELRYTYSTLSHMVYPVLWLPFKQKSSSFQKLRSHVFPNCI